MDNNNLEKRIADLERKLAVYERMFVITPTKIIVKQSMLVNGLVHTDRVYRKATGNYVEVTT